MINAIGIAVSILVICLTAIWARIRQDKVWESGESEGFKRGYALGHINGYRDAMRVRRDGADPWARHVYNMGYDAGKQVMSAREDKNHA